MSEKVKGSGVVITIRMSLGEQAAHGADLRSWVVDREGLVAPAVAKTSARRNLDQIVRETVTLGDVSVPGTRTTPGRRRGRSVAPAFSSSTLFSFWTAWFVALHKGGYKVSVPAIMSPEEAKQIRTLLLEYGEEKILHLFHLAVADWPAMQARYRHLPSTPVLRQVFQYRRELAAAADTGGMTSLNHRVSGFRKDGESPYASWEKKS